MKSITIDDDMEMTAAMAFIESFNVDKIRIENIGGSGTGSDNDSANSTSDSAYTLQVSRIDKGRRKRKFKPGYSTDLLHRKKAEMNDLRNQVPVLEEWLKQLKSLHSGMKLKDCQGGGDLHGSSQQKLWATKALVELQRRRQAELLNCKLKDIQAKQVEVGNAVLATLQQTLVIDDTEFISRFQMKTLQTLLQNNSKIVEKLQQQAVTLYDNYTPGFMKKSLPSFGCRMQSNGTAVEIVSRTPVNTSVETTSDTLWGELKCPDTYTTERGPDSMLRSFELTLQSRHGNKNVHGLQCMQKFEQVGRIDHVWVFELIVSDMKAHFRGHARAVISNLSVDPLLYECDIKFCAQLFMESQDEFSIEEQEMTYAREAILDPWSLKLPKRQVEVTITLEIPQSTTMEMTSSVMRFALATYFMNRGGSSRLFQVYDASPCASPSYEPSITTSDEGEEVEDRQEVSLNFSEVVAIHVSNLRQLLVEQRFHDWSKGVAELRQYVATNGLLASLVAELVKLIKRREQDAVCIVQVIEHMCFENDGTPTEIFDQLAELLFEALSHCCGNKEVGVAVWMLRAIDAVTHGLRQFQEQQHGMATQNLEGSLEEAIRDCLR